MIDFSSNIVSKTKPLINYLKGQQENRKFVETVELGSTVFLIAFFLLFAIRPTVLVISSLLGEINSKKVLNASLKNKINNIIMAQDSFSQVQERYLVINSGLPSSERYSYSANQIIAAAQAAGVSLSDLSFTIPDDKDTNRAATPNKNLRNYSVTASTGSDFPSILKYVDRLINNRRHFEIPSISITALQKEQAAITGSSPGSDKPVFKLSLNTFYWKE